MATPQSLPCAKNTDAAKFLLDPAKNLLDLPDAFRPKLCCVSVETDNRFARNGHPLRAKRIRKINTFRRCLKLFFFLHELFQNKKHSVQWRPLGSAYSGTEEFQ